MYSDAAQGHGSILIEFLIETASSMHVPNTVSLSLFFPSNFISFKDMMTHLWPYR